MSKEIQHILCALGVGLCAAWWTWNFLVWRREHRLSKRLEKMSGVKSGKLSRIAMLVEQLRHAIRRRMQSKVWKRDLPDFFELLALSQSAGMSLPSAWEFASRTMDSSVLVTLFNNVQALLRVGQSWDQALTTFAHDIDDERCAWIVGLMRQNLRRGSPLAEMLIDQVEQWRYVEAMNAERRAQTLSLKLLLPIFMFLLPAVFVILFAPLLLRFSNGIPIF